jgi:hypothetical protein
MELGSVLWGMIASTPIFANLVGSVYFGNFIVSRVRTSAVYNRYLGHIRQAQVSALKRVALDRKLRNVPAYLRVVDLNNIYVQNITRLAETTKRVVESNGQHLANLYSIPLVRKIIKDHLNKKEGRSLGERFMSGYEGDRDMARRNGINLDGRPLTTAVGGENRRVKL